MRDPVLRLMSDELIIDCFAGGGGASVGIEMALGRSPDIAINHDRDAIEMHKANHPNTEHYIEDVFDVDPEVVCKGRKVGLAWFSPDCTEHSRAKNGAIKRDKKVRGLAWIVCDWAKKVRPRVILMENVREWLDWGPLDELGRIDPTRKGEWRELWWATLERLGYKLSVRIIKSCDYGAPTSRERMYIIARCDGIDPASCWSEPTHGPGRAHPYRTAAECIDYSLPAPSIFMTKRQARAFRKRTGIACKRPLADKTMRRIRRGLFKYVIKDAKPFTVRLTGAEIGTSGYRDDRAYDIDEPMRTVTAAPRGEFSLVAPVIARYNGESESGGNDRATSPSAPLGTVTTENRFAVVAPLVTPVKTWGGGGNDAAPADRPLRTVTTSKRGEFAVVAPTLIQTGYGERPGQKPRALDISEPLGTIIAGGDGHGNGKHAVVQSTMRRVGAWIYKGFGGEDSSKRTGGFAGAASCEKPLASITCRDHNNLALSHMIKLRGTSESHMDASSFSVDDTVPTISAGGTHIGEVRAFLRRYAAENHDNHDLTERDLAGIVSIDGEDYQIVDIGMRMLEPRELFRAQGFPDSYIIDPIVETTKVLKSGRVKVTRKPLSRTAQVEKCGNSVTPPVACAIVRGVFPLQHTVPAVSAVA